MNIELIRRDFPILETKVNEHQVVYFDNAATTQRPLPVIQAVTDYLMHGNGNPHRGAHVLLFMRQKYTIRPKMWSKISLELVAQKKLFIQEIHRKV